MNEDQKTIIEALEPYNTPEHEIGGTRFVFGKVSPMEGMDILEDLRVECSRVVNLRQWASANPFAILLAFDKLFVRALQERLFKHVRFVTAATSSQILRGAEDTAFEGLEPIRVYEVLIRSLSVNFIGSVPVFFEAIS